MSDNRFNRWQGLAIAQLAVAIALVSGLSVAGMGAGLSLLQKRQFRATPIVERKPTSKEMLNSFLIGAYKKLPFALKSEQAHRLIEERQMKIITGSESKFADEPVAVRRRIA